MGAELVQMAADVVPYATAAGAAYGGAVLTKVRDDAAEGTVDLGRRLLQKIFGKRAPGEGLPEVLADAVAEPEDADNVAALRKAIRKALEADEALASDVRTILAEVQVGDHANVVAHSHVEGHNIQIGNVRGGVHINDDRR